MAKKKKKNTDWQDWEDAPDETEVMQGNGDNFQVHLRDYVIEEKVSAFVKYYESCDEFDQSCERFDESRLRDFFKATVCGLGDPLKLYLEDLKMAGLLLEVSVATGEPCLFVRQKS